MLGPIRLRGPEGVELSFFGMFATFDTPFDVTTSELAIEFVFPAGPVTAAALEDPTGSDRHGSQWLLSWPALRDGAASCASPLREEEKPNRREQVDLAALERSPVRT